MFHLYSQIATEPLRVRTPNQLGRLPATVSVRLYRTASDVHQGLTFQCSAYSNSTRTRCPLIKRNNLATDDQVVSLMFAIPDLIQSATFLRQEVEKIPKLAESRYRENYYQNLQFTPIFQRDGYIFLDRPLLFPSAAEFPPLKCIMSYYQGKINFQGDWRRRQYRTDSTVLVEKNKLHSARHHKPHIKAPFR